MAEDDVRQSVRYGTELGQDGKDAAGFIERCRQLRFWPRSDLSR